MKTETAKGVPWPSSEPFSKCPLSVNSKDTFIQLAFCARKAKLLLEREREESNGKIAPIAYLLTQPYPG